MSAEPPNLGRKSLLVTLGVAVGAVALGVAVSWLAPAPPEPAPEVLVEPAPVPPRPRAVDPEVLALLGAEIAGERELPGLKVLGIEGVVDGRIRLELALPAGEPFFVEVLRKDPAAPPGIAETPELSLYLVGKPGARTPEEQGQAVIALARRIEAEERKGVPVPALRSLAEKP